MLIIRIKISDVRRANEARYVRSIKNRILEFQTQLDRIRQTFPPFSQRQAKVPVSFPTQNALDLVPSDYSIIKEIIGNKNLGDKIEIKDDAKNAEEIALRM